MSKIGDIIRLRRAGISRAETAAIVGVLQEYVRTCEQRQARKDSTGKQTAPHIQARSSARQKLERAEGRHWTQRNIEAVRAKARAWYHRRRAALDAREHHDGR